MRTWFLKKLASAMEEMALPAKGSPEALLGLARSESIVFTSTEPFYVGAPTVVQYFTVEDQTQATRDRVLSIAGSLGAASGTVLMSAVESSAIEQGLTIREVETDVVSECGVTAKIDRTWFVLGDEAALALEEIDTGFSVQTLARQIERDGAYVLYLAQVNPKRLMGVFACAYTASETGIQQIEELKKLQVEPVLLSSARATYVKAVSKKLGITHCYTDLTLEEKDEVLAELGKKQPTIIHLQENGELVCESFYRGERYSLVTKLSDLSKVLAFGKAWEKRGRKLFA